MDAPTASLSPPQPAWKLDWLTPARCRVICAAVLALGFLAHLRYLTHDCPIDLSGDEAQYWDWSRQLDVGYYSKGPLVAYVIRASTAVFGDHMWAVRLPALAFAVATSLLTYWLTRRLFKSDRLALGVVLLNHTVPMFGAGSLLMTIDPPYFFCWGLATAFLALAALENKRWAWGGVGVAVGVGTLAKYGALLWPIGMFAFLAFDPPSRRHLRTVWPYLATVIAFALPTPLWLWIARHDWVTFKHVATQTGATGQSQFFNGNFIELVGSQVGVIGPALTVIMVAAIGHALQRRRALRDSTHAGFGAEGDDPDSTARRRTDRALLLLLYTGLPLIALCVVMSLHSKMQVNWPAATYFSWTILAAYFLSTRLAGIATWRRWRGWLYATVVYGLILTPVAHHSELLYPLLPHINKGREKPVEARDFDFLAKLKGWRELGQRLTKEMKTLHDPFIVTQDYMHTAEAAFYVEGHPKTFCLGPYVTNLGDRRRRTQYDLWPDRRLDRPELKGRDALYVGYKVDDLYTCFKHVEELPSEQVYRNGQMTRRFKIFRCRDFQGITLKEPSGN